MTNLTDLRAIAQTKYDQQRLVFQEILSKEDKLRTELKRIAELDAASTFDTDKIGQMHSVGADILWRGWLSRSKSALNADLARLLSRKALELESVKRAFGRIYALETIAAQDQSQLRRAKAKANLYDIVDNASNRDLFDQ